MIRQTLRNLVAGSGFCVVAGALGVWAAGDAPQNLQSRPRTFPLQNFSRPVAADLASFATTLARPLFSPDRRPLAGAETAGSQAASAAPDSTLPVARLVAVAIGPDRSAAVVQLSAGGTQVLMQGEHIDDWVLAQVTPDHVVLRQGTREASVALPAFPMR